MLALIAQYNDPIGAILFWFGLFVLICLALTYWFGGIAIRNTYNAYKDQQERQVMRDEIDARTLRKLREEQVRSPQQEAQEQPSQHSLPRWNETADSYKARRRRQPHKESNTNIESYEAGKSRSPEDAVSKVKNWPVVDDGFSEKTQNRYCTNCGTLARAEDRFCAACGHGLVPASTETEAGS